MIRSFDTLFINNKFNYKYSNLFIKRKLTLLETLFFGFIISIEFLIARSIQIDPLNRVSQLDALGTLQYYYLLSLLVAFITFLTIVFFLPKFTLIRVCDYLINTTIGITIGIFAGGLLLPIRGTNLPYGFDLNGGDRMTLISNITLGGSLPNSYPPIYPQIAKLYSEIFNLLPEYSFKKVDILIFASGAFLVWIILRTKFSSLWTFLFTSYSILWMTDPMSAYKGFGQTIGFLSFFMIILDLINSNKIRKFRFLFYILLILFSVLMYGAGFAWIYQSVLILVIIFMTKILLRHNVIDKVFIVLIFLTGLTLYHFSFSERFNITNPFEWLKDTYFYDSLPRPMFSLSIFLIIFLLSLSFYIKYDLLFRYFMIIAIILMINVLFNRFLIISKINDTVFVNLYPRSVGPFAYILFFLIFYGIVRFSQLIVTKKIIKKYTSRVEIIILISSLLFVFYLKSSDEIDTRLNEYMPREGNPAWLALTNKKYTCDQIELC